MAIESNGLLDEIGRNLLSALEEDARLSYAELGRRIGLSPAATAVPGVPRSALVIAAVSSEELEKVVVRAEPFHWTCELGVKPLPFTVSVKFPPPSGSVFGEMRSEERRVGE